MANGNSDENEDESLFVQSAEVPFDDLADAAMDELLQREQDAAAPFAPEDNELTPVEKARILNKQSQQQQVDTYRFFKTHPVTLSTVLPFQKEIVIKMLAKDSLLILGRGLGMVKIASNLIHAIDVAGNGLNDLDMSKPKDVRPTSKAEQSLVIVLGALDRELDTIKEELRELAIIDGISTIFPEDEDLVTDDISTPQTEQKPTKNRHRGVTVLKTDSRYTVEKRASLYAKGGVYIVTSRIFIVDILSNVIDPNLEIMETAFDDSTKTEEVEEDEDFEIVNVQDSVQILDSNDLILIHTYDKQNQEESLLQEISPSFIIMYEPDTTFIRRAEIYRSSNPYKQVRVYFMYYGMSVEEQRYLAAVRKEKDAFTRLVREKAGLPITIVNDLDTEDPEAVYKRLSKAGIAGNNNTKTRIAGGQIVNRLPLTFLVVAVVV
ncbi:hypothetical protein D0Z00_002563 [Geotrichum galactomycetum]|uniref:Uncharacterized protein n=1 Tax=Geotrichum galactomycetum TaxID=27317 RepID=A0ACB6V3N7_9ASCO|nr:hypothetical protein D0Z00_002563 [Geotrichum candidum]